MKVLIVGSGLGGLCCAIACRRGGLDVLVIDQAEKLSQIGAGIQLPPNAARIMSIYGIIQKLEDAGAVELDGYTVMDYSTGEVIVARPGKEWARKLFKFPWYAIHRAAYQDVLFSEAQRLGAKFRFGARAISVDFADSSAVILDTGEALYADAVVGADGINSNLRSSVLGKDKKATPTGDIAYRAILSRAQMAQDPVLVDRFQHAGSSLWWGPDKHVMFYPIQDCNTYNLVLLCKDDLPENVRNQPAESEEMREIFEDWDPILRSIISQTKNVRKWRLGHMEELETWRKDRVALLGDACHPTLPYQAQGATMAVEDGAILGKLLSLCNTHPRCSIEDVLELYEKLRKKRTTLNVMGAAQNKELYRLTEGKDREERNEMLRKLDFWDPEQRCPWYWGDNHYQRDLMAVDTLGNAEREFMFAFQ